jgi:hypothetical protein
VKLKRSSVSPIYDRRVYTSSPYLEKFRTQILFPGVCKLPHGRICPHCYMRNLEANWLMIRELRCLRGSRNPQRGANTYYEQLSAFCARFGRFVRLHLVGMGACRRSKPYRKIYFRAPPGRQLFFFRTHSAIPSRTGITSFSKDPDGLLQQRVSVDSALLHERPPLLLLIRQFWK